MAPQIVDGRRAQNMAIGLARFRMKNGDAIDPIVTVLKTLDHAK